MERPTLTFTGRYYRWYPAAQPSGTAEEPLSLPVEDTVFLLVDVYGARFDDDFVQPSDTPSFYQRAPDDPVRTIVRDRIVPARAAAKRAGLRRVYVTNYLSAGLSERNEWRIMSIRTCAVDVLEAWRPPTPILEHARIIAPEPDEPVVRKQHYSGFFETNLDSVLRGYGAHNLVVVGFDGLTCLRATVTDALFRDYRVVVLRDAMATTEFLETADGGWANLVAIKWIEGNVGYTAETSDFIAACDAVAANQGTHAG